MSLKVNFPLRCLERAGQFSANILDLCSAGQLVRVQERALVILNEIYLGFRQFLWANVEQATVAFFQVLSNLSFIKHCTIDAVYCGMPQLNLCYSEVVYTCELRKCFYIEGVKRCERFPAVQGSRHIEQVRGSSGPSTVLSHDCLQKPPFVVMPESVAVGCARPQLIFQQQ